MSGLCEVSLLRALGSWRVGKDLGPAVASSSACVGGGAVALGLVGAAILAVSVVSDADAWEREARAEESDVAVPEYGYIHEGLFIVRLVDPMVVRTALRGGLPSGVWGPQELRVP